jgi:hypothetical protein
MPRVADIAAAAAGGRSVFVLTQQRSASRTAFG